jgi:hypothetical protein
MSAIVSKHLFSFIKPTTHINGYDVGFYEIRIAMISLFKVASPSDWFRIMHDAARKTTPDSHCFEI